MSKYYDTATYFVGSVGAKQLYHLGQFDSDNHGFKQFGVMKMVKTNEWTCIPRRVIDDYLRTGDWIRYN